MIEKELEAMKLLHSSLSELEEDSQERVIAWLMSTFKVTPAIGAQLATSSRAGTSVSRDTIVNAEYATFADLYNSAQPVTAGEKALVGGYWLQICSGEEDFPSQTVNKALQNLGHALSNVTDAFNQLREKKPALAIQLKKSGKSQQSRKTYKLTQAGIDYVVGMLA